MKICIFLYTSGEPCTNISTIWKGYIECTGPQVTDENCTFTCDPGYYLTGSDLRTCQSNHTWTGETAFCSPLHCTVLTASDNALVRIPCNTEYTSDCNLVCKEGFHVDGDPGRIEWIQKCGLTDEGDVKWEGERLCIGE